MATSDRVQFTPNESATGRDPVPGTIIRSVEIPARHGAALEVRRGQVLRVIDVSGEQVGDLVCFNREELMERYSPQNTILFNRTIYPKVGALLVFDRGRPMMRLVADTVGVHDLICGSCSEEYYKNRLGHAEPHRSCRQNLAEAMAPWGVAPGDIPSRSTCSCGGPWSPTAPSSRWRRRLGPATTRTSRPRWTSWSRTPRVPPTSRRPTRTTRRRCGSSCTSARADRAPAGNPGGARHQDGVHGLPAQDEARRRGYRNLMFLNEHFRPEGAREPYGVYFARVMADAVAAR